MNTNEQAETLHEQGANWGDRFSATRYIPLDGDDCTCLFSCGDDPAEGCSLSGREWHVHPQDRRGVTGPCPVHPDAPGDL